MANYFGNRSDGADVTISSNVWYPSTLDGDMIVKQYGNLTIEEDVTVTTQYRCRGLLIFVDGDLTLKPNSSISMVKKGCKCVPNAGEAVGNIKLSDGDNCAFDTNFSYPARMFDNSVSTSSYYHGESGYITIDLLSPRKIYGINIIGDYTYGFSSGGTDPRQISLQIETSNDGSVWDVPIVQTFEDVRNLSKLFSPTLNGLSCWDKRYFRITVTDETGGNNYVRVQAIEMFAHDDNNEYWDVFTEQPSTDGNGVSANGLTIPFETSDSSDVLLMPDFKGTGNASKNAIDFFSSNSGRSGYNVIINPVGGSGSDLPDYGQNGIPGYDSATSSGGGGSGAGTSGTGGLGAPGTCFSGGSGGGGGSGNTVLGWTGRPYGGKGGKGQWRDSGRADGGTGNPGGDVQGGGDWNGHGYVGQDGTGGLLIIIVKGNVDIQSGASLDTSGTYDNSTDIWGLGGSSGGGPLVLAYGGDLTNNGIIKTQSDIFVGLAGHQAGQGGAGAQILLPITAVSESGNDILVYKYNGENNTQGELQCVIFYDKILDGSLIVGGATSDLAFNRIEYFIFSNNTSSIISSKLNASNIGNPATMSNNVYFWICGGYNGPTSTTLDTVEKITKSNLTTNAVFSTNLPIGVAASAYENTRKYGYIYGGFSHVQEELDTIIEYELETETFSTLTSKLTQPKGGPCAINNWPKNTYSWICGGIVHGTGYTNAIDRFDYSNTTSNATNSGWTLVNVCMDIIPFNNQNFGYVAGGWAGGNALFDQVYRLTFASGSGSVVYRTSLTTTRMDSMCCNNSSHSDAYIFGGDVSSHTTLTNIVEQYNLTTDTAFIVGQLINKSTAQGGGLI